MPLERAVVRPLAASPPRLLSVDALRGAAVILMVFFNNIASSGAVPPGLKHVRWNGFALPDGVFPLFLFVAGVSMALSAARRGPFTNLEARRLLIRVAALIGLGLLLNLVFYGLPLRYPGILQRIALGTLIAFPFVRARTRWVLAAAFVLLATHSWLLLGVSVPGVPAGSLGRGVNLAGWVDVAVLGREHLLGSGFDPEGLLGVLTTAAEVLLGVAAGQTLARRPDEAVFRLILGGIVLATLATVLTPVLPVNKRLFTATFVLVTAGVNAIVLAVLHQSADREGRDRLVRQLVPLGRNAILVYAGASLLSGALARIPLPGLFGAQNAAAALGAAMVALLGPFMGALALSSSHAALWWGVAGWLDGRGLHVRL